MNARRRIARALVVDDAGSVLVEALAALVLLALAGSVVAAAATTNLRALQKATVLERLIARAVHELSLAQARGAPIMAEDTTTSEADVGILHRRLEVTRDADGVATLTVRMAVPDATPVELVTRMRATE